jgi:hypothetical protein
MGTVKRLNVDITGIVETKLGLRHIAEGARDDISQLVETTLTKIQAKAKTDVRVGNEPKKKGERHLRDVIKVKHKSRAIGGRVIGSGKGAMHGNLIEFGTKPHKIPRKKTGRVINHPGHKAYPYMNPALESEESGFVTGMRSIVAKHAREFSK